MNRNLTLSVAFLSLSLSLGLISNLYTLQNSAYDISYKDTYFVLPAGYPYAFLGMLFGIESFLFFRSRKQSFSKKQFLLLTYLCSTFLYFFFWQRYNSMTNVWRFVKYPNGKIEQANYPEIAVVFVVLFLFLPRIISLRYFFLSKKTN